MALSCGADLIDCKDPSRGALGALPVATIAAITCAVGDAANEKCAAAAGHAIARDFETRRVPVSATIGDCVSEAAAVRDAMAPIARTGVDIVKVGFQPSDDVVGAIAAAGSASCLMAHQRVVAVFFADLGFEADWIDRCAKAGFSAVMVDTAAKSAGGLRSHLSEASASRFIQRAHSAGLAAGLAGGLGIGDAQSLVNSGADILGFRGGLCAQANRRLSLDADAIKALRRVLNGDVDC